MPSSSSSSYSVIIEPSFRLVSWFLSFSFLLYLGSIFCWGSSSIVNDFNFFANSVSASSSSLIEIWCFYRKIIAIILTMMPKDFRQALPMKNSSALQNLFTKMYSGKRTGSRQRKFARFGRVFDFFSSLKSLESLWKKSVIGISSIVCCFKSPILKSAFLMIGLNIGPESTTSYTIYENLSFREYFELFISFSCLSGTSKCSNTYAVSLFINNIDFAWSLLKSKFFFGYGKGKSL